MSCQQTDEKNRKIRSGNLGKANKSRTSNPLFISIIFSLTSQTVFVHKFHPEYVVISFFCQKLRREKVELENTLEQEQEALVNKLWKRMDKLEAEKRLLLVVI